MYLMGEKVGGICGILGPLVGFVFISLSISYSPWFSFTDNWLSDLGVDGFPALLFNSGLAIAGLSGIVFSLAFIKKNPAGYVMLVTTISLVGVGLFNEKMGAAHLVFSVLFFVSSIVSMLVLGVLDRGYIRYLFLSLAVISVIAWLPFVNLGTGAMREAISATSIGLVLVILGYEMVKSGSVLHYKYFR
jgi:hypothetical membrane protein